MSLGRSLLIRNFALLWSGQTVSRLGDQLQRIALAWWVLEKTGSAAAMGTVLIFTSAPMVLLLLVGGVAVDRFHRPRVMFLSDLVRGLTVGIVAFLMWQNLLTLPIVYVLATVFGIVNAFFQPAYVATVPDLVPAESRPSANSLTALSGELAGILGPALGAGIVKFGGTSFAFALDAVSFFVLAALLWPLLRLALHPGAAHGRASPLRDLGEGFRTVLASPFLWVTIALASIANFTLSGPFGVALPFLVNDNLKSDVGGLGLIYSAMSAGSVALAVLLGRMKRMHRRGLVLYLAWFSASLLVCTFGLPVSIWTMAVAAAGFGGMFSIVNLIWTNTLQEMIAPEQLGRVSSIDYLGSFGLNPFGFAIAGWATDRFGAPIVFLLGGLVSAGCSALAFLSKQIRTLD